MKFYIVNTQFNLDINLSKMLELLASFIHHCVAEAKKKIGDDAIVVIVMHEYALSYKNGMSPSDRKNIIQTLSAIVDSYDNLIVIPGTLVSMKQKAISPEKQAALTETYQNTIARSNEFNADHSDITDQLTDEFEKLKKAINPEKANYLKNTAYIFASQMKMKHHKSIPSNETALHPNSIFYLGGENCIYEMKVLGKQFNLGLLVCMEVNDRYLRKKVRLSSPLMEVIISHGIPSQTDNMSGAINIHNDVKSRCAYFNPKHSRANEVEKIIFVDCLISSIETLKEAYDIKDSDDIERNEKNKKFIDKKLMRLGYKTLPSDDGNNSYILNERDISVIENPNFHSHLPFLKK